MSFMCQFANCVETATPIIVTDNSGPPGTRERARFCCLTHAALYLSARAAKSMNWADIAARHGEAGGGE